MAYQVPGTYLYRKILMFWCKQEPAPKKRKEEGSSALAQSVGAKVKLPAAQDFPELGPDTDLKNHHTEIA